MINNAFIVFPPLAEQTAIATYLDRKCSEIDTIVRETEKTIEEYKKLKQSLITEVVTGKKRVAEDGLSLSNEPRKMKHSGVEWIGDVPEEWVVTNLGHITNKIGSGSTPTGGAEIYVNEGVKFMRSQNVHFEGFVLDDVAYITNEIDELMKGTRVQEGDILFNITGASIGRCYYVDENLGRANVNQHVCIVRPNGILTKYLNYYLQSEKGQLQVKLQQTGGNREGLSAAAFS